jgi:ADP-ribosylglycohydrolase
MRVSAVGYAYNSLDEVLMQAKRTAEVTHDHPEGIKGAAEESATWNPAH